MTRANARKAALNGVELAFESFGTGEPVLLIGGSGMPPAGWQFSQVPALTAAGYRVVTFASRGVSPSQAPPPPYTIADMAADTAALIEHLGLAPCRLVGASLGGFIAEELTRSRPDLVRAAVLIASAGRPTAYVRAKFQAERELFAVAEVPASHDMVDTLTHVLPLVVLQNDDATVDRWVAMLAHQRDAWTNADGRRGQLHAAWAWMLDGDRTRWWADVRPPCLVVAFEHDPYFPPRVGREAAAAMSQGEFVELRGASHGGLFEKADEINRLLISFFGRGAG